MELLKQKTRQEGITLIALVITIIVLLILSGISISVLTGESGILTQAEKAKISSELSGYKEELEIYKTAKYMENRNFLFSSLTAGKSSLTYNTQSEEETGSIKTIITSINDEYLQKLEVIKGELLINTKNKEEVRIAQSVGIKVNPYDITEDGELLSSNGNLLLMDEEGTLTIPNSVTKIGEGAFANLEGLKTIIIPGTVKEIGTNAFAFNVTLEKVIMQEGVEVIGNNAFSNCLKLKEVYMPESLMDIKNGAFMNSSGIERIIIPSKIENIKSYVFYHCDSLKEIKLSDNIKEIQDYAFAFTSFPEIILPEKLEKIGSNVFASNIILNNIIIKGTNSKFKYQNGLLTQDDNIVFASNKYLKNITNFDIPEGMSKFNLDINAYNNITKITIPSTLTELLNPANFPASIQDIEVKPGNSIFAVEKNKKILYTKNSKILNICFSKEETIDLRDENNEIGIKQIYDSAFLQTSNAKNIILPKSLESISQLAFQSCNKLELLKIGENVSKISGLFKYGNDRGVVVIDENNPNYKVENNILYNKDKTEMVCALYNIVGEFKVDDNVTLIGDYAFHNQNQMTSVVLPIGLRGIGESFAFCSALKEINIPSTVESISTRAFNSTENLSRINVEKKQNSIPGAPWGAPKGMKVVNWKQ